MQRDTSLDDAIRDIGPVLTDAQLAELFGINVATAKSRRYKLGIYKGGEGRSRWADIDLDLFFALFQTEHLSFIAECFGKTADQTRDKARYHGWKRPASYYAAEPNLRHLTYPPELRETVWLNRKLRKALNEQHRRASGSSLQGVDRAKRPETKDRL